MAADIAFGPLEELTALHPILLAGFKGRQNFSVAGPAIWNWLPDSLRDLAISRDSFKRSLKTFLFSAYSCK